MVVITVSILLVEMGPYYPRVFEVKPSRSCHVSTPGDAAMEPFQYHSINKVVSWNNNILEEPLRYLLT